LSPLKQNNEDWLEWLETEIAFTVFWKCIQPDEYEKEDEVVKYRQSWKWVKDFLVFMGSFI